MRAMHCCHRFHVSAIAFACLRSVAALHFSSSIAKLPCSTVRLSDTHCLITTARL